MLGHETGQIRNDGMDAETGGHAHPQQAAQIAALADALFRVVEGGENDLDPGQELGPGLGRGHRARRPRQQPNAKFGFEIGHDARGLRLRQSAFAGGGRETAKTRDARIELEGEDIFHGIDSWRLGQDARELLAASLPYLKCAQKFSGEGFGGPKAA